MGEAGELFTVVVGGPGSSRWGVIVRAVDEEQASQLVAAGGNTVLSVDRGARKGAAPTRWRRSKCLVCGYSLQELPSGSADEVQCPECGAVNLPEMMTRPPERLLTRARWIRIGVWLLIGFIFGALVVGRLLGA